MTGTRHTRWTFHGSLLVALFCVLLVAHLPYLSLPFFWDEAGQFVPAALDIYREGAWIPRSVTPNSHPPGVMAYLAAVWQVTGYSIAASRVAMLALAAVGVWLAFLLAILLARPLPGVPAFWPLLLLLLTPQFYTQAMMVQLDMPAMVAGLAVLLLFFAERHRAAAAASVVLVLCKETGILLPGLLALWLLAERRWRVALWYLAPLIGLAVWFAALFAQTGSLFGDRAYTEYNLTYPLHPVRLGLALLRRTWTLLGENLLWVGVPALFLGWRAELFRTREWRILWTFAGLHAVLVSVLGGAVLDRYLLPVVPIVYCGMMTGWSMMRPTRAVAASGVVALGLLAGFFVKSPYPFPFENNLAMVDLVRLHELAADWVEDEAPVATTATVWPLTDALRRPDLGYVHEPRKALELHDFSVARLRALPPGQADVLIVYTRTWDGPGTLAQLPGVGPALQGLLSRYYGYTPSITAADVERELGFVSRGRWLRNGLELEIFSRPGLNPGHGRIERVGSGLY